MRYLAAENRVVWSASDLKAAAECEFAWMRALDAKLGRVAAVDDPADAMLERAARLGDRHEERVLERYRAAFGEGVVEIDKVSSVDAVALSRVVDETRVALSSPDAQVVFQAAFRTDDFVGFADFLVRDDDGRWRVQDSKLARRARTTALMQLAAYVVRLDELDVPRSDVVDLLLGDGTVSTHRVDDLLPLFHVRRARLDALIADRRVSLGADASAISWGDERGELGVVACGRCATCESEVVAGRDLLLVAGMRPVQRTRLRAAGIRTIDDLAGADGVPAGMAAETFDGLRLQARLQLTGLDAERAADAAAAPPRGVAVPAYEVVHPAALGAMPRPSRGDIFFDFEGDPLYAEERGSATLWGLDYLFGWVDLREQYSSLWAHDLDEEREALDRFCEFVASHRAAHPDMHIYHYAPYEPTHLAAMAARHGIREDDVDRLLREEVFVDLYPVVRRALRVGSRSYSIKKLEPLYMGDEVRTQDVQKGDDSIVRYVEAISLRDEGEGEAAQAILDDLADYNRYDCVSTRRLRDWLIERARESGVLPAAPEEEREVLTAPAPHALALGARAAALRDARALAGDAAPASADEDALRMAAAAVDYYPREAKSFWHAHFARLREPIGLWSDTRDVLVVDATRSVVSDAWEIPDGGRSLRRLVELRGDLAPGTRLSEGGEVFLLYPRPAPFVSAASARWIHVPHPARIVAALDDGAVVEERAVDGEMWDELPVALAPGPPPRAGHLQAAIDDWATALVRAGDAEEGDGFPADPASDLLRRRPPRRLDVSSPARAGDDTLAETPAVDAVVRSVLSLDRSALAVQGPPGTGKTYVGSRVIAHLVAAHGYRVGVVAQSHAVVENMLDRVIAAGVPAAQVAKAPRSGSEGQERTFTAIRKNELAAFIRAQTGGFVVGGTAWDLAHPGRIARGGLDLLVIDEAGQFSLASTIAVSVAARSLLLLGDPQQLPQVSQGVHPEPIDTSALGWIMAGEPVLPESHGVFLSETWRMHPAVTEVVSRLSYAGRLAARDGAEMRDLEGVAPGVHPRPLRHRGNATSSPEEAAEVVAIVDGLIGRAFTDIRIDDTGTAHPMPARPLDAADIIVVAPYNAQQREVEEALARAGHPQVRVGTVDRFQGQEAAVSIVTLAASSGREAPRGTEFLLLPNRLNVAISRAKVASYLVYSPALLDDVPFTPDGVARMSAFARLTGVG